MNKTQLHVARLGNRETHNTIAPWLLGAYAFERFYQGPAPQEMEDGGNQEDVVDDGGDDDGGVDDGGDDVHYHHHIASSLYHHHHHHHHHHHDSGCQTHSL